MTEVTNPEGVLAYIAHIAKYRDSKPALKARWDQICIPSWWCALLDYGYREKPEIRKAGVIHGADGWWFRDYQIVDCGRFDMMEAA